MKKKEAQTLEAAIEQLKEQPETFTPGFTKGMVRQHAYRLYRDKLEHGGLTLEDWVLAEKDLLQSRLNEGVEA
jgi:hypothetical protein